MSDKQLTPGAIFFYLHLRESEGKDFFQDIELELASDSGRTRTFTGVHSKLTLFRNLIEMITNSYYKIDFFNFSLILHNIVVT